MERCLICQFRCVHFSGCENGACSRNRFVFILVETIKLWTGTPFSTVILNLKIAIYSNFNNEVSLPDRDKFVNWSHTYQNTRLGRGHSPSNLFQRNPDKTSKVAINHQRTSDTHNYILQRNILISVEYS